MSAFFRFCVFLFECGCCDDSIFKCKRPAIMPEIKFLKSWIFHFSCGSMPSDPPFLNPVNTLKPSLMTIQLLFIKQSKQFSYDLGALILVYFYDLRWLNTVFDTCVPFTFFSKTLDLSVTTNGSKQVNNTNFGFLMVKLTYVPLFRRFCFTGISWQHLYSAKFMPEYLVMRFSL